MKSQRDPATLKAVQAIAKANGGLLQPDAVVEAARPVKSPLHRHFIWDDTKAAHQHRLEQARRLIRIIVEFSPVNLGKSTRVFVSLTPDRSFRGGGYRTLESVLSNEEMRKHLLRDALEDMERFEEKYRHLNELAGVFTAYYAARKKHSK